MGGDQCLRGLLLCHGTLVCILSLSADPVWGRGQLLGEGFSRARQSTAKPPAQDSIEYKVLLNDACTSFYLSSFRIEKPEEFPCFRHSFYYTSIRKRLISDKVAIST